MSLAPVYSIFKELRRWKSLVRNLVPSLIPTGRGQMHTLNLKKFYPFTYLELRGQNAPCFSEKVFKFNDMFNESIKQAGANIPAALKLQAKEGMFKAFVAREIMMYEAKKEGFYETTQAKSIENFLTRSAVTSHYIDKTIRSTIPTPTEEEINLAYERYGKMYNIDSLPYADAQKALASLVIEAKTQQKYQILVTDLRYRYNIEKNIDLLLKK